MGVIIYSYKLMLGNSGLALSTVSPFSFSGEHRFKADVRDLVFMTAYLTQLHLGFLIYAMGIEISMQLNYAVKMKAPAWYYVSLRTPCQLCTSTTNILIILREYVISSFLF